MLASQSYKPNYDEWKVVFRMLNTTLSAIFHKHQRALRARQSQSQWSQSSENYRDVAKKENKVFQFIFKVKILRCFPPSQMRDDRGTDLIWFTHVYDGSVHYYITSWWVRWRLTDWLPSDLSCAKWFMIVANSIISTPTFRPFLSLSANFTVIILQIGSFAPILSTHPTGSVLSFYSFPSLSIQSFHNVLECWLSVRCKECHAVWLY